jgi:UDP-N-acetylglucosamine transferase subunit ALG13
MPFDRLVVAMNDWAAKRADTVDVFAQIGRTDLCPRALRYAPSISPSEFNEKIRTSTVIVAHAGMGSVLTALEVGKPLVLMPRRGDRHETRNDHQLATAKWLAKRKGIFVAMDETELPSAIDRALTSCKIEQGISPYASPSLIQAIQEFVGR